MVFWCWGVPGADDADFLGGIVVNSIGQEDWENVWRFWFFVSCGIENTSQGAFRVHVLQDETAGAKTWNQIHFGGVRLIPLRKPIL